MSLKRKSGSEGDDNGVTLSNWLPHAKCAVLINAAQNPTTQTMHDRMLDTVRRTMKHNALNPLYFDNINATIVDGTTANSRQVRFTEKGSGREVFGGVLGPMFFFDRFSGSNFNNGGKFSKAAVAEASITINMCLVLLEPSADLNSLEALLYPEHVKYKTWLDSMQQLLLDSDPTGNARIALERGGGSNCKEQPVVRPSSDPTRFHSTVPIKYNHAFKVVPKPIVGPKSFRPQTAAEVTAVCEDFYLNSYNRGLEEPSDNEPSQVR